MKISRRLLQIKKGKEIFSQRITVRAMKGAIPSIAADMHRHDIKDGYIVIGEKLITHMNVLLALAHEAGTLTYILSDGGEVFANPHRLPVLCCVHI